MKYYFVTQIRIDDNKEYEKYLEGFDSAFEGHNGRFLAIDENPEVLEGKWDYTKSVIISFNSKKEFESWYYSDDYQKILKHRLKAAKCDTLLVKGL
ncbi:MAG: DUF1330 domain-containing protein [Bacteroidales bacterium]